jgi:hypothetical protein
VQRLGADLHFRTREGLRGTTLLAATRKEDGAELVSGGGNPAVPPNYGSHWTESFTCRAPVLKPSLLLLRAVLNGEGHVMFDMFNYRAGGREVEKSATPEHLWDGVLAGRRRVSAQFVLEPGQCAEYRLRLVLLTPGRVSVESLEIARAESGAPDVDSYAANLAEAAGWSSFYNRYYSKAWDWGWSSKLGAIVQLLPARLPAPAVGLATPPILVGAGPAPLRFIVELDTRASAPTKVYLERLAHIGPRSICRDSGFLLSGPALIVHALRGLTTTYPIAAPERYGPVFRAGGAAETCYRPAERFLLAEIAGSHASRHTVEPPDGYEALRVLFVQSHPSPRSGAGSELVVRGVRVFAVNPDATQRALYDFEPKPGELPAIR